MPSFLLALLLFGMPRADCCGADEHELRIVCRIIEAAIWFVMAEEIALEPVLSEN